MTELSPEEYAEAIKRLRGLMPKTVSALVTAFEFWLTQATGTKTADRIEDPRVDRIDREFDEFRHKTGEEISAINAKLDRLLASPQLTRLLSQQEFESQPDGAIRKLYDSAEMLHALHGLSLKKP
jgi:uncharacterized damage-inducible protein DinB